MASPFAITTASTTVQLPVARQGEAVFTVSNTSGRQLEGRAQLTPTDPTTAGWFKLDGDVERDFSLNETHQYNVRVAVPSDAQPGTYTFHLDMVGVENPDEQYTRGPTVRVEVPAVAAPAGKPFPWWIIAVVVGVLLLGSGLAAYLIWGRGGGEDDTIAQAATQTAEAASQQTAAAATQIAQIENQQTAAALTQTAEAATQTAVAGSTQTAEAGITQTAVALRQQFVGDWRNVDANTGGMTRLVIEQINDSTFTFHGFGSCSPTDCDWGVIEVPFTPSELVGTYDFGFVTTQITVSRSGDQLIAILFDDYTEADGRSDRTSSEVMKRAFTLFDPQLIATIGPAER